MNRTHMTGLGAGLFTLLLSASAFSQTIVIDPGCGSCAVNLEHAVGMAHAQSADRIEWAPGVSQIEDPGATLDIDRDITIVANGAFHPIVTWGLPPGQPLFRVGNAAQATLRLERVVLSGAESDPAEDNRAIEITAQGRVELVAQSQVEGFRTYEHGTISNLGELMVEDTQFYNNFSHGYGGAIFHQGTFLTILRSSIYQNHARLGGGGVALDGEGIPGVYGEIYQSSLFGNVAGGLGVGAGSNPGWPLRGGIGGGLFVQTAHIFAENTTLSRNLAESDPVSTGVASNAYISNVNAIGGTELRHVTLADGGASNVEGLYIRSNDTHINASIIHAALGSVATCDFGPNIMGHDVVVSDNSCTMMGNNIVTADPQLAPLSLPDPFVNGAVYQTPYHPIAYFGPAVDNATSCPSPDDQREVSRPLRQSCDMGAYELEPLTNDHSLAFDGVDDYVDMGNPTDLTGSTQATISFWMKVENNWQTIRYLLSRLTPGQKQLAIQTGSFGRLRVNIARDLVQHLTADTVNQPIQLDTWHHVAVVFDGTQPANNRVQLYVDAILQPLTAPTCAQPPCTYPQSLTNPTATSPLRLGASSGSPNWYFTGKLDEVAIFDDTAMTAADVVNLYGSGAPDVLSVYGFALTHWWRFDGDTLPTIADHGIIPATGTMVQMEASDFSSDVP